MHPRRRLGAGLARGRISRPSPRSSPILEPGRTMPTFAEQLILLLNDEHGVLLPIQRDAFECALAGAVLMDLAFARRIDTDPRALVVNDHRPTGSPLLDRVLAKIAARPETVDTRTWIRDLSIDEADAIREETLTGLVDRGVLKRREGKLPWVFRSRRHPAADDGAVREIGLRIADVLHSDDVPDPRDAALVSLLDACDVLPDVFPGREVERCRPRIEQLRKMDLIGREVAGAITDTERTIALAIRSRWARARRVLLHLCAAGGLAASATLLAPRIPVPDRFGPTFLELLWFDGTWRQWSGYVLLGFSGAGLAAALLMRTRPVVRSGGSIRWRLAHVGFGVGCLLLLFGHTGFRLGDNLNAALMGCYLAALIFGALAGISTYGAARLRRMGITLKLRAVPMRLHVAALFPLPVLLILHIVVVHLY